MDSTPPAGRLSVDVEATVEVDENGWPALGPVWWDEPPTEGPLWEQLVTDRAGVVGFATLLAADFEALSTDECVNALRVWQAHRCWLEGIGQSLLARLGRGDRTVDRWSAETVSTVLAVAPVTAQRKLKDAQQLVDRLPHTHRALLDGVVDPAKAAVITRASYQLADDALPDFEQRVLRHAGDQSVRQVQHTARRAVLALDPCTAQDRRERAGLTGVCGSATPVTAWPG